MIRLPLLAFLLCALGISKVGQADDLRPLYVEVELKDGGLVETRTRRPPQIPAYNHPVVELPPFCEPGPTRPRGLAAARTFTCRESLAGHSISIEWPVYIAPTPAILRVIEPGGLTTTTTLGAGERTWTVPEAGTTGSVAMQYTWLGIEHIWIGFDHLLFLVCLIWIARTLPRILWMVTGFTLSHSATLALSTLGIVSVPVPWVEAVIALSVVFLAVEIAKGERDSLTWRFPAAVAATFGLLHGLGFAAVLAEIGLPDDALFTGLLFFNVGVEIGQVAFVIMAAAILAALRSAARDVLAFERRAQVTASYVVGSLASLWLVERIAAFPG